MREPGVQGGINRLGSREVSRARDDMSSTACTHSRLHSPAPPPPRPYFNGPTSKYVLSRMQDTETHGWVSIVLGLKPTSTLSMPYSDLYERSMWIKVIEELVCLAESTKGFLCLTFYRAD